MPCETCGQKSSKTATDVNIGLSNAKDYVFEQERLESPPHLQFFAVLRLTTGHGAAIQYCSGLNMAMKPAVSVDIAVLASRFRSELGNACTFSSLLRVKAFSETFCAQKACPAHCEVPPVPGSGRKTRRTSFSILYHSLPSSMLRYKLS